MLEEIRKKPEKEKTVVFVFLLVVSLFLLFCLWYFLSNISFGPIKYDAENVENQQNDTFLFKTLVDVGENFSEELFDAFK